MTNREAFELWYKATLWNYSEGWVDFIPKRNGYNHESVQSAWMAWNAALHVYNVKNLDLNS